jgi:GntR family transcriptional regulator
MKKTGEPPIPAYYRLQKTIQEDIEKGRWKPGDSIPAQRSLAELHNVSIGTVRNALLNLTNIGYLYRIQGKGTFVAGTVISRVSLRYCRLLERFGEAEVDLKVQLLKPIRCGYFKYAGQLLGIDADQKLYKMQRLFISGHQPMIYNISYMPANLFKDLEKLPKNVFESVPLYIILEEQYGLPTIYNHELFDAIEADSKTADLLKIPEGSPVLHIEMLSFTYKDKSYEYREAYCSTKPQKVFREI